MSDLFLSIQLQKHQEAVRIPLLVFLGLTKDNCVASVHIQLKIKNAGTQGRVFVTWTEKQDEQMIAALDNCDGVTCLDKARAAQIGLWMSEVVSCDRTLETQVNLPSGCKLEDVNVFVVRECANGGQIGHDILTVSAEEKHCVSDDAQEAKPRPRKRSRF